MMLILHPEHADWLELLFDLIFVAAISQLALNLTADYSPIIFLEYIPVFFAVWWSWVGHTFYLSRFGADDMKPLPMPLIEIIAL